MLELNHIYCGDCLDLMPEIEDGSIDMILADVPYGITACKWDKVIPFEPMWKQIKRIIKPNGAIVMTASQPFTTDLINSNRKMFKYCWVWNKVLPANICNAKYQPMKIHEDICVFSIKMHKYYPIKTLAKSWNIRPVSEKKTNSRHLGMMLSNDRCDTKYNFPKSIIEFNNRIGECNSIYRIHSTQKPVALFEYLIKTYTNEGDTVLDFVMGSGTTPVACIRTKRNYIAIEIDPEIFETAQKRIDAELMQFKLELA